jgi:hypothetical protein
MSELVVRIVLALAATVAPLVGGPLPFQTGWRAAAVFAAYSALAYLLERRGFRSAGVAGLVAAADAGVLCFCLAAMGQLERFGFAALLPMAWATLRFGSSMVSMAPIGAAWILVGANLQGSGGFGPVHMAQALVVLALGLLAQPRTHVRTVREVVEVPVPADASNASPMEYTELRESFRTLRDHAQALEARSRKDRLTAHLWESAEGDLEPNFQEVAKRARTIFGCEGLTLYSTNQSLGRLVVQAATGDVPEAAQDSSIDFPPTIADWQLRERANEFLRTLRDPDGDPKTAAVVLQVNGRTIGLCCLFDSNGSRLSEALDRATEASETLGKLVRWILDRTEEARRLKEAESLYVMATVTSGSNTPLSLAGRVAKEVWETLRIDSLSLYLIADGQPMLAAEYGHRIEALDLAEFEGIRGFEGWAAAGFPETVLLDARTGQTIAKEEAVRRRIGSFVLMPIGFDETPVAFLTAATNRVNGIDPQAVEALRALASEAGQAFARLTSKNGDPSGLATPAEFFALVQDAGMGTLVYLEVPRREELEATYGRAALEFATRKFATRLRAMLPSGAAMTRRAEGDYVVFLRGRDLPQATNWANEATTTASLTPIRTPDGRARIPLGVRAKVAAIDREKDQVLVTNAA